MNTFTVIVDKVVYAKAISFEDACRTASDYPLRAMVRRSTADEVKTAVRARIEFCARYAERIVRPVESR